MPNEVKAPAPATKRVWLALVEQTDDREDNLVMPVEDLADYLASVDQEQVRQVQIFLCRRK